MRARTQPVVRIAAALVAVFVVLSAVYLFFGFRAARVSNTNLSAREAHSLLQLASAERGKLMRRAFATREFKLLWQVISSHPDSVSVSTWPPRNQAIVSCSGGLNSRTTLLFFFQPQNTNDWKFQRWMAVESPRK